MRAARLFTASLLQAANAPPCRETPAIRRRRAVFARSGYHPTFQAMWGIGGQYRRFQARVGVDAMYMNSRSYLAFEVWGDERKLWESGTLSREDAARAVDIDVAGVQTLKLVVRAVSTRLIYNNLKWADWGEAKLLRSAALPERPVPGLFEGLVGARRSGNRTSGYQL